MQAPKTRVQFSDGKQTQLASLYREKPVALIFLRHLACIFCERNVAQWKDDTTSNVVFVCRSIPEAAEAYGKRMSAPQAFIADYQVERCSMSSAWRAGSMKQIFSLHTIKEGFRAYRAGFRGHKPTSDPTQLGGTFVIDIKGEITFEDRRGGCRLLRLASTVAVDELEKAKPQVRAGK